MDLWYTEKQTENVGITCKVKETLHAEKTDFQDLAVLDTLQFGRMLVLDGMVQATLADEFVYHEMITHVPLFTHPRPQDVVVIGGGDGGAIREILHHPSVRSATLVEIDRRVVEVSRRFLPEISGGLADARVTVRYEDGIKHIAGAKGRYDCVMVDSTEPVGPAVGLFSREFYQDIYAALREDGIFVAQTESPFFNQDLIRGTFQSIREVFPIARLYLASVPTYPSGLWSFTVGSRRYDPLKARLPEKLPFATRYYTPAVHRGAFALPAFVEALL
ncbi:MAG: polyamine aminopropyltransferase [Firmicutes bacterium]|nr:polyamine aminopropyltransferase [Bacillota bacterium]